MTANAEDYKLVLRWEQEFQDHYISTLVAKAKHAAEFGSPGEAVQAKANLEFMQDLLIAKKAFMRKKLENHMLSGLESVVESFQ